VTLPHAGRWKMALMTLRAVLLTLGTSPASAATPSQRGMLFLARSTAKSFIFRPPRVF